MSETVPNLNLASGLTMKMFVTTLSRRDYALLEEMLAIGQRKIPSLRSTDDVVSAIIAETCARYWEQRSAGQTPTLPGVPT